MQKDKDELKPNKTKKTLTGQPASEIDPHPRLDLVANINKGKTSDSKFFKKNTDKGMQNEMVELILDRARFKKNLPEDICETSDAGLAKKAAKSGVSIGTLRKVYRRGVAAWNSGHRPGTTPQQWGMARVNSYITKGKGTYHGADKDLHERDSRLDSRAYHAGVSPDTAKDRVTHWRKMDKLSDRDPRAYKPAPGDKDPEAIKRAQTTPGSGTAAYHRMYGESMDEELLEACWDGYKQVGVKKKGKRMVPNCVPGKESFIDLSEVAGAGPIEMDQLVRMFMAKKNNEDIGRGMDDASYTKVFSDAMQHYVKLLQDAKNKGKPWEQVAKTAAASFPEITPYGLFTGLKEILGIGDSAIKNRIVDEAMQKMTARERFKAGLKRSKPSYDVDARHAEAERYHRELMKKNAEVMARLAADKNKVDEAHELIAMPSTGGFINDSIVKLGNNKFRLVSKKTGKNLGTYPSRASAVKREKQVQYFKNVNEASNTPSDREKGTDSLTRIYKHDTPGQNEEALGKIQRTSGGPKKFMVKVKDPSTGNVKTVRFGDPNMKIKRDSPERRKSFRARHQCDTNPGPRTKARYWSCRQWRSGSKVEG